jgi:cytochrome c-type biogenesis protein
VSSRNASYLLFLVVILVLLVAILGNAWFLMAKSGNKGLQSEGTQPQNDLGAPPIFFEPQKGLNLDNKTHIVFLYYTSCPSCEDEKHLYITKSYPTWKGNLTDDEITINGINYFRKKDVGEAYFKSFNISASQFGGTVVVIHNSKVGVVFYPPLDDMRVQKVAYYLAKGSVIQPVQMKKEARFSQPLVYALGAISGFNPCLIALASFFFATATKTELRSVAKRIGLISLGLIYAYIIFFSMIASNPAVMGSLASLTWLIALILVGVGLLYFVEVGQDIYSRKWGSGSSIEPKVPLFRTPEPVKNFLATARSTNSPVYDFGLGVIFSLIKLPCIALFLLILLVNSVTPLMDVIIFTLGVATPIIVMGLLIGLGMIKVNRLSTVQFKGRLVQRTIIGAVLLISAVLVLA